MIAKASEEYGTCVCCGEVFRKEELKHFKVKSKPKEICPQCADIVHGLI